MQLLLEPEEHVPIIQSAVKRFDIVNPVDGLSFPDYLPTESLPSMPDPEMLDWHEGVSQRLMLEAQGYRSRGRLSAGAGQHHRKQLSDGHSDTTAPTEASTISSSFDGLSITDGRSPEIGLAQPAHPRFQPPPPINVAGNDAPMLSSQQQQSQYSTREPPPWSPGQKRSASMPQPSEQPNYSGSDLSQNTVTPTAPQPLVGPPPANPYMPNPYDPHHNQSYHHRGRTRSPSTLSTISTDSTLSSLTSSSGASSRDHSLRRSHHHPPPQPPVNGLMPSKRPAPPRRHSSHQLDRELIPTANNQLAMRRSGDGLSNANTRGLNVRWGEDQVFDLPPTKKPELEDIAGVGEGRRRGSSKREKENERDNMDREPDRDRYSNGSDRRTKRRDRRYSSSTGGSDTSGSEGLEDRYRGHRSSNGRRRGSDGGQEDEHSERRKSWDGKYDDRRRGYARDYDRPLPPPVDRRRRHDDYDDRYDSDRRRGGARKHRGSYADGDGYDRRRDERPRRDHYRG